MTRRHIQIALLAVLLVIFAYVVYQNTRSTEAQSAGTAAVAFVPLPVENPALRLDLLERVKNFEYQGPRRNIFSAAPPPPPVEDAPPPVAVMSAPQPSGPPPVVVPAQFFGQVTDLSTGTRRAFFSEGEEVYVVGVGDVLLGRFRLLSIGNNTVEVEEMASGRRATLAMEEPSPL